MRLGQISTFIILGLVIVILVLVTRPGALMGSETRVPAASGDVRASIISLTESCLEQSLREGLRIAGAQGGYIYQPGYPGYLPYNGWQVGLSYYRGQNTLLSLHDIAYEQLAPYILQTMQTCTNMYQDITSDVTIEEGFIDITISPDEASVLLTQPRTWQTGNTRETAHTFSARTPTQLAGLHATAQNLIDAQTENPGHILLSHLDSSDYTPQVITLYPDVLLTTLHSTTGEPRTFRYASQFALNSPPTLLLPGEIQLKPGQGFTLLAHDPENGAVTFATDTPGFSIKEGILTSTLTSGRHTILITAIDPEGATDTQDMEVMVG